MTVLEKPKNALDVIDQIKDWLTAPRGSRSKLHQIDKILKEYDLTILANAVELEQLTRKKADDAMINHLARTYNLTLNQVVGYLDLCELLNETELEGTGVVAVPFWFNIQYNEMNELNKALSEEAETLQASIKAIVEEKPKVKEVEGDVIPVPKTEKQMAEQLVERTSILTGNTRIYVPGQTGPRQGDEHLDVENNYPSKLK